ncbi:H-type lectin domain-containing protein [Rhodovulum sp. YNF3179]|uniref:H-type lectin domain-containing protein n=1 Tax=Rhodovulum sp. YNF3179 TaxID=3425127 RepID=UPI003D354149
MERLDGYLIGIDRGSVLMFSHFDEGGPMWAGSGPREVRRAVRFSGRFRRPPSVQAVIEMWDFDSTTNLRADITAEAVTGSGCELVFRTWGDTRIARLRAGWMAIGELPDPAVWDLS